MRVTYHLEDGTWWADSPDFPGLTAVAHDVEGVRELVLEAATDAFGPGVELQEDFEDSDAATLS